MHCSSSIRRQLSPLISKLHFESSSSSRHLVPGPHGARIKRQSGDWVWHFCRLRKLGYFRDLPLDGDIRLEALIHSSFTPFDGFRASLDRDYSVQKAAIEDRKWQPVSCVSWQESRVMHEDLISWDSTRVQMLSSVNASLPLLSPLVPVC